MLAVARSTSILDICHLLGSGLEWNSDRSAAAGGQTVEQLSDLAVAIGRGAQAAAMDRHQPVLDAAEVRGSWASMSS